jgi:hypothetical protein
MDEVLHAMTTRRHAVNGIHQVSHNPGFPVLLPFLPPKERLIGDAARSDLRLHWAYGLVTGEYPGESQF